MGVCYVLRVAFIFRHIKCLSTCHGPGAPFESVFQEVLGEGDQAGPNCVHGLRVQLKDKQSNLDGHQMEGDRESDSC